MVGVEGLRAIAAGVLRPFPGIDPEVRPGGTLRVGPGAVAPVILIRETAAGPADDRRFDGAESVEQCLANAAHVGNFRRFAHPDAVIDHRAEMFDEMAIDLGRNGGNGLVDHHVDSSRGTLAAQRHRERGDGGEKGASVHG